jgi:hypothetical protein
MRAGGPAAMQPAPAGAPLWHLFAELRHTLGLTRHDLAVRLATSGAVIEALESGDERGLPPWPETVRIVTLYLGLAGIDARPVLKVIEAQRTPREARRLAPPASAVAAPARGGTPPRRNALVPMAAAPPRRVAAVPAVPASRAEEPEIGGVGSRLAAAAARVQASALGRVDATRGLLGRRAVRRSLAGLGAAAALALFAWSSMLQTAVVKLAPPAAGAMRYAYEFVLVQMAPQRDGLRWIEVADPRSRRGDKLQIARR